LVDLDKKIKKKKKVRGGDIEEVHISNSLPKITNTKKFEDG